MRKIKITSLILAVIMVFSMLPIGMLPIFAEEDDSEAEVEDFEVVEIDLLEKGTLPNGTAFFTREMSLGVDTLGKKIEEFTVPVTTGYTEAMGGRFTPATKGWYGAEGFLLSSGAFVNGNMEFAPMLEVNAGFGGSMEKYNDTQASYIRGKTNPNTLAIKGPSAEIETEYEDWTSVAYLSNDGKTWVKQEISTDIEESKLLQDSPMFQPHGYRYMYIPLSSFRYTGAANGSTIGIDTRIGMPFFEFLSIFEEQSVKFNLEMPANPVEYTMSLQFVYAEQTIEYDYESVQTEPIKISTLTIGDSSGIQYPNYYTEQTDGSKILPTGTTEIITENMYVNGNDALTDNGLAWLRGVDMDLSNVAGIRFKLDTSALGKDAQLMLRMRLLQSKAVSTMTYSSNTFLNAYTKENMALTETYTSGGNVCLVHRGADSAAYYKGTVGKKAVEGVMYTNGDNYTSVSSDGFLVPANFVGEVYIPLSSYYVSVTGSYSSKILLPYISEDGGLDGATAGFTTVNQIALNSNINGSPEDTTVIYDEIEWVYKTSDLEAGGTASLDPAHAWLETETTDATPDEITIDTAEELLIFASLLNTETFEDKTIKLTTSIELNRGWSAAKVNLHDSISENRPAQVWPVVAGAKFAGTFDGQGFSISGIYLKTAGDYVGIFGNVPTKAKATVQNLAIINSYVEGTGQGVGAIFGQVDNETTAIVSDPDYVNETCAIIDNVYLDAIVYGSGCSYKTGLNKDMGTGGFIGGSRADVSITNSVFAGTVSGHLRGVAAFVGSTRPYQGTHQGAATNFYRATITIENCVSSGDVIAPADFNNARSENSTRASYGFIGGLVGYANGNTNTFNITNVLLTGQIVDGVTYFEPEIVYNEELDEDVETGVMIQKLTGYAGYLYGGCFGEKQSNRANDIDFQVWNLNNVKYVANSLVVDNEGLISNELGNVANAQKFVVDDDPSDDVAPVSMPGSKFNDFFAPTPDSKIPSILFVRPNPQMTANVSFNGETFTLSFTLDASEIVVKDDAVLKFNVNGAAMDVSAVDGKYTITYQNITFAELTKEYTVTCKAPKSLVFMNLNLDEEGKEVTVKVGGTTSVKKVLTEVLAIESMNDDIKAYASDLFRVAETQGVDISDVTLLGGKVAPSKDSKIEVVGEAFTGATVDFALDGKVTLTVATDGNAGVVTATLDGAPVAMKLENDTDLVLTLSVKDLHKTVVLSNGTDTWTGSVEAVVAQAKDANLSLLYSYAVSMSQLLK